MTKVEEKLIEKLKKELRSYFWGYDDEQTTKFADKIFGIVYPFISKSYHSGKLAGFKEMAMIFKEVNRSNFDAQMCNEAINETADEIINEVSE